MDTPVCLLVFNRPETTERVFQAVAHAQPTRLFVVADGARPDHPEDEANCREVRRIVSNITWQCEVQYQFAEMNLGLRERVVSGFDWLFSAVDAAIIIEDDCLPHPDFFTFCSELLRRYRDDERIMAISGDNFQEGRQRGDASYYFSRLCHIWGWATWARAWQLYDRDMAGWSRLRATPFLEDVLGRADAARYWHNIFDDPDIGSTWDYQWVFSVWAQHGLTALPNENLVSNIGWGSGATHTTAADSPLANLPTSSLQMPLSHPSFVYPHRPADDYTLDHVFGLRPRSAASRVRARARDLWARAQ